MQYPLFIAKRIIFNAQPSFSRFIIRLAVTATGLSVATMIVTLSLVNGFQEAVADKVFSFWGDARIQPLDPLRSVSAEGAGFLRNDATERMLRNTPEIVRYHAFAIKSVVLKKGGQFEGLLIKGVDSLFSDIDFKRFISKGKSVDFSDPQYSKDVLLSDQTALRLDVQPGDTLQCFFIRNGQDIQSRLMRVSGLFHTGIEEYDRNFALADIRFLQKLNQWPEGQIGGYEMWMKPGTPIEEVSFNIDKKLPIELTSLTIQEVFPNIFDWLGIQNQTKQIVIITMLIVAIINLITCLLILVMERTRMVGVLKALGMAPRKISHIFWLYSGWIAVVGVSSGLALGLGLCWLQQATGFIKMDELTYYVAYVPISIHPVEIMLVTLGSFTICLLAVRLPLLYVQRISPIKAIRFN